MRFIPDAIVFQYTSIKTGIDLTTGRVEHFEDKVRLQGNFDIFTESALRGDFVLNQDEVSELNGLINRIAKRYENKVRQHVLGDIKRELHG